MEIWEVWRGAYRGLLVPSARAEGLCVKESITFQSCEVLQQMSALHSVESLSIFCTHTHLTHRFCWLFCLLVHIWLPLPRWSNETVRSLIQKIYNKQRKLETRQQTFWVVANIGRDLQACSRAPLLVSAEQQPRWLKCIHERVHSRCLAAKTPLDLPAFFGRETVKQTNALFGPNSLFYTSVSQAAVKCQFCNRWNGWKHRGPGNVC